MPRCAVLGYAVARSSMVCCITLCYAMLPYAVLRYAVLHYTVLCYAMLCCAMLCYAMLCCAVLCCAVLCCAVLLAYDMLCSTDAAETHGSLVQSSKETSTLLDKQMPGDSTLCSSPDVLARSAFESLLHVLNVLDVLRKVGVQAHTWVLAC